MLGLSSQARFDPDLPAQGQPLFEPACAKCHKRSDRLGVCGRCQSLTYCSKECQKRDVKCHKKSCLKIKECKDDMNTCLRYLGMPENCMNKKAIDDCQEDVENVVEVCLSVTVIDRFRGESLRNIT